MEKKKRLLTILGVAGLIPALVAVQLMVACAAPTAAPAPAPAPEEKIVWDYQCIFPETDGCWTITSKMWKEMIEQRTNGRIEFVLHAANTVVPDLELLDAVKTGVLDCAMTFLDWNEGIIGPAVYLERPGCFFNHTDTYWLMYYGGLIDIVREAYAKHNLYYLADNPDGSTWIFTTFPVNKLDDLKGKKIIASGEPGKWITKMGAAAVDIPMEEMYMSVKLGTVDGLYWTALELETAGWGEVCRYIMTPAHADPTCVNFIVNLDSWNALPDDLKKIMNEFGQDQWWTVGLAYYNWELRNIELAKEHYGTRWVIMPEEEIAKALELHRQVWEEAAATDPLLAKGWEIMKAYKPIDVKW